jgi:uncharacterized protein involved in exopolysaccharide biosynthesis
MKIRVMLAAVLVAVVLATPSAGENKDMIALQTQMNQLLKLQQSIDEKMGVLQDKVNTLSAQIGDNLKNVSASVDKLDKALAQQQQVSDSCVDQVVGQAQPLQDSIAELKASLAAINKQLSAMNNLRQQAPGTSPAGQAAAPPPSENPR